MADGLATWYNASSGAPSYNAQLLRQADVGLMAPGGSGLAAHAGARPGAGLDVTVSGTTITITAGTGIIQGASSTAQGAYRFVLPATTTRTLTAANATNPRIDLVYMQVRDTDADSSGFRDADIVYLAGTAAATPATPTIPAGVSGAVLATISVPHVGAGSPAVSYTSRQYAVAAGGITPGALPVGGLYTGQYWDDGTTLRRWNGASWDTYVAQQTIAWIALPLATGSGFTANGNSNGTPGYRVVTRSGTPYLELRGGVNAATDPAGGSATFATLPIGARPAERQSVPVAKTMSVGLGVSKVDINTDGTCAIFGNGGGGSTLAWFSLNGLCVPMDAY